MDDAHDSVERLTTTADVMTVVLFMILPGAVLIAAGLNAFVALLISVLVLTAGTMLFRERINREVLARRR